MSDPYLSAAIQTLSRDIEAEVLRAGSPENALDALLTEHLKLGCNLLACPGSMMWLDDGDAGAIRSLYDPEGVFPTTTAQLLVRQVAASQGPMLWGSEIAGAPVIVSGRSIGALVFYAGGRALTAENLGLIASLGQLIGGVIQCGTTDRERERARSMDRSWNIVLETIAENKPIENTLTALAQAMQQHSSAQSAAILLRRDGFVPEAITANLPEQTREPLRVQIPRRAEHRHARFCENAVADPVWSEAAAALDGLPGCLYALITSGNREVLGIVSLHYPGAQRPLESDHDVLLTAAGIASKAIEHSETMVRLAFEAQHDSLTGLPNRLHFMHLFEAALAQARRSHEIITLLFIDLDRFKQINDTLGHAMGDRVLQGVATRLKSLLPSPLDFAARMAGDEFTVVLTNVADEDAALEMSRYILRAMREPYHIDGYELFVTGSIGMSVFPAHGEQAQVLLRRADLAMYRAKAEGGSALYSFLKEPVHGALEQFELETALRRAIEKNEFEVSYHPLVDISGRLDGLEALLSWNHPKLGRTPPKQFIPIAEESGLIAPIGSWVMAQVCLTAAKWRQAQLRPVRLSVNVSAVQFSRSDFVDTVAAVLSTTGFPPEFLELELTETYVLRDIEESAKRMARIRELGVTLAIDDFGSGYSSFSYLRRLPVNSLKIDQSLLRDLAGPGGSVAVLQSIVLLAHSMALTVVAEGVETLEELELLRTAGCDKVQGHLYGEALSQADATLLLARKDPKMPLVYRVVGGGR